MKGDEQPEHVPYPPGVVGSQSVIPQVIGIHHDWDRLMRACGGSPFWLGENERQPPVRTRSSGSQNSVRLQLLK